QPGRERSDRWRHVHCHACDPVMRRMRDLLLRAKRALRADARRPPGGNMHAHPGHSHGATRRFRRGFVRGVRIASVGVAVVGVPLVVWVAWPLPADIVAPGPVPSLEIQDRHGITLRTTRSADGSRGGWTSIDDIDPELLQAFLAAEDARFFAHHGVDPRAALRAARDNIAAGRIVSGASTITMQTARLLRPTGRGWVGKIAQTLWALRIDAHLDKQRILEIYLNRVPLGQGAIGVSAAARLYFGVPASDLSL